MTFLQFFFLKKSMNIDYILEFLQLLKSDIFVVLSEDTIFIFTCEDIDVVMVTWYVNMVLVLL